MEPRGRGRVEGTGCLVHDTGQDDLSLVRSAAGGRPEAFDALVLRHQDRLYGIVHRLVGDPEKAMDLVQETFLKAWRGLPSFEGGSAFFTWLYRIARNVVTSAARYEGVRPKIRVALHGADEDGGSMEIEAADAGPELRLSADERRSLVLGAIAALPPDFREIVVLRDMEDRAYEEIADLLEIPVGTVRSRLHRARMELKERLKHAFDPAR